MLLVIADDDRDAAETLAELLRLLVLGSGAPTLIAVTGHADMTRLARASSAFDHALLKPVNVDELLGLLSSL